MADVQVDGGCIGTGLLDDEPKDTIFAESTKVCKKCAERKPLDQFYAQLTSRGKFFRHHSCIACQYRKQQEYRSLSEEYKNSEREKKRQRYQSWSPEKRAEYIRQCTERRQARMLRDEKYAERIRQQAMLKKRLKSTPEQRAIWAAASRKSRELNPEVRERARQWAASARRSDIVKYLVKGAKSRSVQRGHEFDLTVDWARARWTGKCELTGIEFVLSSGCIGFLSPSLDKVDPAKGYTQNNCRFILACLNSFKGAASDTDMMLVARALVAREN